MYDLKHTKYLPLAAAFKLRIIHTTANIKFNRNILFFAKYITVCYKVRLLRFTHLCTIYFRLKNQQKIFRYVGNCGITLEYVRRT